MERHEQSGNSRVLTSRKAQALNVIPQLYFYFYFLQNSLLLSLLIPFNPLHSNIFQTDCCVHIDSVR